MSWTNVNACTELIGYDEGDGDSGHYTEDADEEYDDGETEDGDDYWLSYYSILCYLFLLIQK